MEALGQFIKERVDVSEEELVAFLSSFKTLHYEQEDFLLQEGTVCRHYFFIESGTVRIYYHKEGKEYSAWIATENSLFTELASYNRAMPTRFSVQALTETVVQKIGRTDCQRLSKETHYWNLLLRRVWEEAFINIAEAVVSFQSEDADERYDKVVHDTELVQRVPQKLLSSFLGITPTSLSRIRARKNK